MWVIWVISLSLLWLDLYGLRVLEACKHLTMFLAISHNEIGYSLSSMAYVIVPFLV